MLYKIYFIAFDAKLSLDKLSWFLSFKIKREFEDLIV